MKQLNWLTVFSFVCIYLIWGSTYLGIRFAIVTIPPWFMAASRFIAAGSIMFGLAWFKKEKPLTSSEKSFAVRTGLPFMLSSAAVCYVEKWIPSGVVAVLIGAMPIWMMLVGRIAFGRGTESSKQKYFGAILGLIGVTIIAWDDQSAPTTGFEKYIFWVLLVSNLTWAFGTQLQKNMGHATSPFRYIALQMLSGGAATLIFSFGFGEMTGQNFQSVTMTSVIAWAYLVFFGSVIAFSAYSYLSQTVEPWAISTYALVNPVIAVFLGAMIGHETLSPVFFSSTSVVLFGLLFLIFDVRGFILRKINPRRFG